jgi:hypothetical protein
MIQDQLVEYINSQLKLGVSRDAIKSALVGVGWQVVDVDDTFKKIDGTNSSPIQQNPVVQEKVVSSVGSEVQPLQKTVSAQSNVVAQSGVTTQSEKGSSFGSFSPSDIIGSAKASSVKPFIVNDTSAGLNDSKKSFFDKNAASIAANKTTSEKSINSTSGYVAKNKTGKISALIEGFIIVLLLIFSGYLFFQNQSLSSKINGVGGQSSDLSSQVQNLNSQVQGFTSSNAQLTNQVASLTAENTELQNELSFVVIPTGSSTSATATTTVSVSGLLTRPTKTGAYLITTNYGVKVYVQNYKDKNVNLSLGELLGSNVNVSGSHILGSAILEVSTINGTSINAIASSTVASSSASNGPMMPAGTIPPATTNTVTSSYQIQ